MTADLVPTAADVRQLSKAVQGGIVNYCPDQGTPNFLAITPVPPISTYLLGQHFRIKVANKNTGPSQLNVNNLGWAQITHGDLTQMGGGELLPGQMIEVAWDGAGHWQMLTGGVSGSLINLTSTNVFYVNAGDRQRRPLRRQPADGRCHQHPWSVQDAPLCARPDQQVQPRWFQLHHLYGARRLC